jgi:hypothetical protein
MIDQSRTRKRNWMACAFAAAFRAPEFFLNRPRVLNRINSARLPAERNDPPVAFAAAIIVAAVLLID